MTPPRKGPDNWLKKVTEPEQATGGRGVESAVQGAAGDGVTRQSLVTSLSHRSKINDGPGVSAHGAPAVDTSLPMDDSVTKPSGMRLKEKGFCAAISTLLSQVAKDGGAPTMPDKRCWSKYQFPALIEESPAEVNIVPRCHELRAEPPHLLQGLTAHDEITARKMLRPEIVAEDVGGGACRGGHDGLLQASGRWGKVGAS